MSPTPRIFLLHDISINDDALQAFNAEGDQWYRAASTLERNGRLVFKVWLMALMARPDLVGLGLHLMVMFCM